MSQINLGTLFWGVEVDYSQVAPQLQAALQVARTEMQKWNELRFNPIGTPGGTGATQTGAPASTGTDVDKPIGPAGAAEGTSRVAVSVDEAIKQLQRLRTEFATLREEMLRPVSVRVATAAPQVITQQQAAQATTGTYAPSVATAHSNISPAVGRGQGGSIIYDAPPPTGARPPAIIDPNTGKFTTLAEMNRQGVPPIIRPQHVTRGEGGQFTPGAPPPVFDINQPLPRRRRSYSEEARQMVDMSDIWEQIIQSDKLRRTPNLYDTAMGMPAALEQARAKGPAALDEELERQRQQKEYIIKATYGKEEYKKEFRQRQVDIMRDLRRSEAEARRTAIVAERYDIKQENRIAQTRFEQQNEAQREAARRESEDLRVGRSLRRIAPEHRERVQELARGFEAEGYGRTDAMAAGITEYRHQTRSEREQRIQENKRKTEEERAENRRTKDAERQEDRYQNRQASDAARAARENQSITSRRFQDFGRANEMLERIDPRDRRYVERKADLRMDAGAGPLEAMRSAIREFNAETKQFVAHSKEAASQQRQRVDGEKRMHKDLSSYEKEAINERRRWGQERMKEVRAEFQEQVAGLRPSAQIRTLRREAQRVQDLGEDTYAAQLRKQANQIEQRPGQRFGGLPSRQALYFQAMFGAFEMGGMARQVGEMMNPWNRMGGAQNVLQTNQAAIQGMTGGILGSIAGGLMSVTDLVALWRNPDVDPMKMTRGHGVLGGYSPMAFAAATTNAQMGIQQARAGDAIFASMRQGIEMARQMQSEATRIQTSRFSFASGWEAADEKLATFQATTQIERDVLKQQIATARSEGDKVSESTLRKQLSVLEKTLPMQTVAQERIREESIRQVDFQFDLTQRTEEMNWEVANYRANGLMGRAERRQLELQQMRELEVAPQELRADVRDRHQEELRAWDNQVSFDIKQRKEVGAASYMRAQSGLLQALGLGFSDVNQINTAANIRELEAARKAQLRGARSDEDRDAINADFDQRIADERTRQQTREIQHDRQVEGTRAALQTERRVMEANIARDPHRAGLEAFMGDFDQRVRGLHGEPELQRETRENQLLGLKQLEKDFLEGFRGEAVDLRLMSVTNERDQINPTDFLRSIEQKFDEVKAAIDALGEDD